MAENIGSAVPEALLGRGRRARARADVVDDAVREEFRATRERWDHSRTGRVGNKVVDWFFGWLFDWGLGDDVTVWSPPRPPTAKEIEAAVDAMQAEAEQAMKERQAAAELTRQHDAPAVSVAAPSPPEPPQAPEGDDRPPVQPVDLDSVALPPPPVQDVPRGGVRVSTLHIDADSDWCTCEGLAGRHRKGDHPPAPFQIDLPAVPSMDVPSTT